MGRRKKEPRSVHRQTIAHAAQKLFMEKGISATCMDEIAKAAGYSKATLYVYFANKEEIIRILVLESMRKLEEYLSAALSEHSSTKARYDAICRGLVQYQEQFPFYFNMALEKINLDFAEHNFLPEERETYEIGERINEKMEEFLKTGIQHGDLRSDLRRMPTIFSFWGMLSGLILTACGKEDYLEQEYHLSKPELLQYGFDMLYRCIAAKEETI